MKKYLKKIYLSLPEPQFIRFRDLKLFEWMNKNAVGKKVLNLGSGIGYFDHYLSKDIHAINLDMDMLKPKLDIVADAHCLPFKDQSFDIVYSISVLEHVGKPWIVADEIGRILKPGGYVVLEVPFLYHIHDKDDYFRFTDKGIRSMFDNKRFETIFEQASSGGGSFLGAFLYVYSKQFIPTRILKIAWEFSMGHLLSLIRYIDILIERSPLMRFTATTFSYIGRKR